MKEVIDLEKTYVAVDIGASSGRLIIGEKINRQLKLKEIYRFKNGFTLEDGHNRWNIDRLISEIFTGLHKVKLAGYSNISLGIDTWGVDYVLVDQGGNKISNPISYRDSRTQNTVTELTKKYSKEYIYEKTGIQFLNFNTLYQLFEEDKNLLKRAKWIMMIPNYIGYVLTGKAVTEVTNASTTQMLNLRKGLFDDNLLKTLNIDAKQFPKLVDAGTFLGNIKDDLIRKYDLPQTEVITVATHDTASAVLGTPGGQTKNWAFLSSGTWSLIGTELNVPEVGKKAFKANYTNEWGAYGTYRFLKNIMGLWMVQRIKQDLNNKYSFNELAYEASQVPPFQQMIDVNNGAFENPANMIEAIQSYCKRTRQKVPETVGEIVMAVYSNLALFYANEIQKLTKILEHPITSLNIVGGGSNVEILNQLTSNLANIPVYAGPDEATAVGNVIVQMIANGEILNEYVARELIMNSFNVKRYKPKGVSKDILKRYQAFLNKLQNNCEEEQK